MMPSFNFRSRSHPQRWQGLWKRVEEGRLAGREIFEENRAETTRQQKLPSDLGVRHTLVADAVVIQFNQPTHVSLRRGSPSVPERYDADNPPAHEVPGPHPTECRPGRTGLPESSFVSLWRRPVVVNPDQSRSWLADQAGLNRAARKRDNATLRPADVGGQGVGRRDVVAQLPRE